MQRKKSFVVVLAAIVFAMGARGQVNSDSPGPEAGNGRATALPATLDLKRTMDLNKTTQGNPGTSSADWLPMGKVGVAGVAGPAGAIAGMARMYPLADDYYLRHLGIMCKNEWQLEKTTHIPLRLRLGSLEECNRMEGK